MISRLRWIATEAVSPIRDLKIIILKTFNFVVGNQAANDSLASRSALPSSFQQMSSHRFDIPPTLHLHCMFLLLEFLLVRSSNITILLLKNITTIEATAIRHWAERWFFVSFRNVCSSSGLCTDSSFFFLVCANRLASRTILMHFHFSWTLL